MFPCDQSHVLLSLGVSILLSAMNFRLPCSPSNVSQHNNDNSYRLSVRKFTASQLSPVSESMFCVAYLLSFKMICNLLEQLLDFLKATLKFLPNQSVTVKDISFVRVHVSTRLQITYGNNSEFLSRLELFNALRMTSVSFK